MERQQSWFSARRLLRPLTAGLPVVAGLFLFFCGEVLAKTAACPCGVCPCSPCTCGGGGKSGTSSGGKSKPHDGGKDVAKSHEGRKGEHHRHDKGGHGHGGVAVDVSVDLGGIGQRKPEADPFAVGGPPVAHTQEKPEKPKTKKKEHENLTATSDPFAKIELTGEQAKNDEKTASAR